VLGISVRVGASIAIEIGLDEFNALIWLLETETTCIRVATILP